MADEPFGIAWHGGAGDQGVSAVPGYLDIGNVGTGKIIGAGEKEVLSAYVGDGRPARLDAVLVQPEIERLLLSGRTGSQGLLRSWAGERRVRQVDLGSGAITAYAYDNEGRLVETAAGTVGSVAAPVEPGGFTFLVGAGE